jgi:hypothetical protein
MIHDLVIFDPIGTVSATNQDALTALLQDRDEVFKDFDESASTYQYADCRLKYLVSFQQDTIALFYANSD